MLVIGLLVAFAPFRVHVDWSEFSNVVYHLSCLSERTPCTRTQIDKFWKEDLDWTSADKRQLDGWNEALTSIAGRQPKPAQVPFLPNFAGYYPELVAVQRIIAAGSESRSVADFRERAMRLASPEEVRQLSAALEHFQRRLRPWWTAQGQRYAAARGRELESRIKSANVTALRDRIARFMESEISSRDFRVHLIPRGDPQSDVGAATFVRNHLFLEVTDKMKPEEAVAIVMHELTHALYERAPLRRHQQLIRDFANARPPQSQALYALLNEGIATGVQFVMLRHAGKGDQDAYRHAFIPRIGRAVSEPLERAFVDGSTLFSGFLETYLRVGAAEFKEELASPRFMLSSVALAQIGDLDEAAKAYRSHFPTISWGDFADRERYLEINLAIMITYDKLDAIAGNWEDILPLSRRHRGFAFSTPRKSKGRVYVLAGRDDNVVAEVVRRLAAMRTGSGDGLVLSVD
jgi:hypothetical protein